MNFPVFNGGIMVVVAAGLLLLILRSREETESRDVRSAPGRSMGRRVTGWSSLATFAIAVASLFFIGQTDTAWIVPVAFGAATLVLFLANLLIAKRSRGSVASRAKRVGASGTARLDEMLQAQLQISAEEKAVVDSRNWDPQSVPSQLYRSEQGTLETPQLAEIVSLEEKTRQEREKYGVNFANDVDATRINLDEILRRRRANGN
jgi:hypothetical protein